MKTGDIVTRDIINRHLDDDYIEVFPNGNLRDLSITTRIPAQHKTFSRYSPKEGQSPLLVRKSYWDGLSDGVDLG
jgi:hypothetical protein